MHNVYFNLFRVCFFFFSLLLRSVTYCYYEVKGGAIGHIDSRFSGTSQGWKKFCCLWRSDKYRLKLAKASYAVVQLPFPI